MIKDLGVIYKGASITYAWDWSGYASKKGTSVNSAPWSTDSSAISLSDESLTGSKASAKFTATQTGCALIACNAVFADGDDDFAYFKLTVLDPKCEGGGSSDY